MIRTWKCCRPPLAVQLKLGFSSGQSHNGQHLVWNLGVKMGITAMRKNSSWIRWMPMGIPIASWKNGVFIKIVFWVVTSSFLLRFNTTRFIRIIFSIALTIEHHPVTLPSTSKKQYWCLGEFTSLPLELQNLASCLQRYQLIFRIRAWICLK